jgi:carbon-monoxide dehydrogenase medium subunit
VQPGELATEALFPVLPPSAGTGFAEVSRRRGDYAVCGVAATVRLDEDGRIIQARAGYLSVGPSPLVLDLTDAAAADQAAAGPAALAKAAAADPAVAAARTPAAAARTAADPATDGAADPAGHASPVGQPGFPAAADLARQQVDPEPDIHATADYRRHLAGVLTQRALLEALGEAQVRGTARRVRGREAREGQHREGMARD